MLNASREPAAFRTHMISRGLLAGVVALAASLLAPEAKPEANRDTAAVGGPGGAAFKQLCPASHSFLVGFKARAGAWVDGLTPLCSRHDEKGFLVDRQDQSSFGGKGGAPRIAACASQGDYVESLTVTTLQNGMVNSIAVNCRKILNPALTYTACLDTGQGCGGTPVTCGRGQAAIGVHGRHGLFIDAVGLICGPIPVAAVVGGKPTDKPKPPLPRSPIAEKIVAYAVEREKAQQCVDRDLTTRNQACPPLFPMGTVGHGECTDLVRGALTSLYASFDAGNYIWGKEVGRRTPSNTTLNLSDIQPGDIIQTFNAKLVDPKTNAYTGTGSQHTAIVESNNGGVLTILEQNTYDDCDSAGVCKINRRYVTRSTKNLNWTLTTYTPGGQETRLIIYRAEQPPGGFVATKSRQAAPKTSGYRRLAAVGGAGGPQQRVRQCPCATGFTHRLADAKDYVCAPAAAGQLILAENKNAPNNRVSTSDNRCRSGFVWRDAFDGDGVCVTPQARDRVHQENRQHMSRVNNTLCR
jgi:hypothetical protein